MVLGRAFCDHLRDAVVINFERKKLYAQMSDHRSLGVSRLLILLEGAAIPIAWLIDRKAARFQKMGIGVIADDFVPMHPLPSYDTAPLYRLQANQQILRQLALDLKNVRKSIASCLDGGRFIAAAKMSYDLLQHIRQMEIEHQCHLAMTRHLLESIGFALLHAPQYAKASHDATVPLSKMFVRFQMLALSGGLWLDRKAGVIHEMGVGILVNDVPLIPFEREFERFLSGQSAVRSGKMMGADSSLD
ncbi:MAG: hypothetical protein HW387_526 [Parachlamydiales bacterium]|nr:hypothetical protein [Parachlamydiales bacterium]